jgi:DNA-binding CsgD family transcriptional regulator/tetratricopeptide (TPR) repeat protein
MTAAAVWSGHDRLLLVPVPRSSDLVGRDAELEELLSTLGIRASPNDTRALLMAGDAGVGKTRLLTELRDAAVAAGWQVVAGHCLDLADSALSYLPFSEILGRLDVDSPQVVEATMAAHPVLARLQPGRRIRGGEQGESASLERGDLYDAVHALLERAAAERPLLVVVEDAHWADQSTRHMLSFLFTRQFEGRVAIVTSYRSDDLHRRHPLRRQVAEWARLRGVVRMQLEPLAADDVRLLVRQLHPDPILESDVADIVARAEGNAFFVEELVGATWAAGGAVPEDLADLLLVRLERLDDAARQVVRTAAVAGRTVTHQLLAAASGLDAATLDGALRGAVEMHVLVASRDDAYSFRHALLGEAVYDDLLPGERVGLHAAFARVLREGLAAGTSAELARHARLGQDHRTALFAAIDAGDDAMSVGGPEEAAVHFQAALSLLSDPAVGDLSEIDRPLLVTRAAEALLQSGHSLRAIAVLREGLTRLGADATDEARGQLLAALAGILLIVDDPDDELALSQEAVRLLGDAPTKARARALATRARILAAYRHVDEAREAALEALTLTERLDMPSLRSDVLTTLAAMQQADSAAEVKGALLEAVDNARRTGAVSAELRGWYLLGRLHQDLAQWDEAVHYFDTARRRGAEVGTPWTPYSFEGRFMEGQVLLTVGRWDDALRRVDVSGEAPPPIGEAMLGALGAIVRAARGERDAGERLRPLRAYWSQEGLVAIASSTAELELAEQRGDVAAALETYRTIVETMSVTWREEFQARLRMATLVLGVFGTAAPHMSADERAAAAVEVNRLYDDGHRVIAFHREQGLAHGPETAAWMLRLEAERLRWQWAGQVDPPEAEELIGSWLETTAAFVTYGHVFELARVRARLAAILRCTGDAAGGRQAGDLARDAARALGARPLLDELTALGSSAAPRSEAAADALTPREGEILALVAEGRTNGEIGKQLFISTKTVSVHVSNILGKLGAASRTEAAAIARRRGLI